MRILDEEVPVRARIEAIHRLSAHVDADGLMRWLRTASRSPERVFVAHGDPDPAKSLADRIWIERGWDTMVPAYRVGVDQGGGR
ncbi:MAG: hypothetical protein HYV93_24320 [Candidatus Rokubacteria bacterium]|nr:hypothetical protein [Candidatus Rokubacteria bacterium]